MSITASGSYTQDFDTLISSNTATWADDSTLAAWYAQRSGSGTSIVADAGSGTSGNLYSYGSAGSTDRALGSLGSNNATAGNFAWGVAFQNNASTTATIGTVAYVGEQWRKSGVTTAQTIAFSYRTSASPITTLTPNVNTGWTAVTALDFASPVNTATASALNGNQAANRTARSATIDVEIPAGHYVMLRWSDPDHTGSDQGLAIDDVSVAFTVAPPPVVAAIAVTGTPAAFTTEHGTASAVQEFAVTGTGLTVGITATAPAGFEVSADGGTYGATAMLGQSGGTLRVRLAATAAVAGSYDAVSIGLASGATTAVITTTSEGNAVSAKQIGITGLVAADKPFDGTTAVTVTGTPAYAGLVNGDSFTVPTGWETSVSWAFADAVVGDAKPLVQTGAFAAPSANYAVVQPALTASILPGEPVSPTILLSASTLAAMSTIYGDASAATSFTVFGGALTGPLTVAAAPGLEVALAADGPFAATAEIDAPGGSVADVPVWVRLAATAPAGSHDGRAVVVSGGGATARTILTASAGNVVSAREITIGGLVAAGRTYDGTKAATVTGTAVYDGLVNGETFEVTGTVSGWEFFSKAAGSNEVSPVGAFAAPNGNYTVVQPVLWADIAPKEILLVGVTAVDKAFDGTDTATLAWTGIDGLVAGDTVNVSAVAFFAQSAIGTDIPVFGFASLGGPDGGNYVLAPLPTGLAADITPATQSITFGPLATAYFPGPNFVLQATASSGLPVSYASSNPAVATVSGTVVTLVGTGSTVITASQPGDASFPAAADVSQTLVVQQAPVELVAWNVNGVSGYGASPLAATTVDAGITVVSGLARGSGVTVSGSGAGNAWGGTGWQGTSDASAVASGDTVSFQVQVAAGGTAALRDIVLGYRRSAKGATSGQWAYAVGGGSFVNVGGVQNYASTSSDGAVLSPLDLSGEAALQSLAGGTTVTFRLANWGATDAGGSWYVFDVDKAAGSDLVLRGTVTVPPVITGTATAAAFTTTYGTASAVQEFAVSGTGLTGGITATAPAGFEVSSDGVTYGTTASFARSGSTASGTLRVRLAATAPVGGAYDGVVIVLSSPGAPSVSIASAATGNVVAPKGLTITGLTAADKAFDGTPTASVTGTPAYGGLVNGESFPVAENWASLVSWAFADAAVGTAKPLVQSGAFAAPSANYTVTQPVLTASILPDPDAALTAAPAVLTTPLSTTYGTASTPASFSVQAQALPGAGVTVTAPSHLEVSLAADGGFATSLVIAAAGGEIPSTTVFVRLAATAPAGSYDGRAIQVAADGLAPLTVSTTATGNVVAPKPLTVAGVAAVSRPYDGTTAAAISGGTLVGVVGSDVVTLAGGGTFAQAAAGTGIAVTAALSLAGPAASNYAVVQPTGLAADITRAAQTITFGPLSPVELGNPAFALSATASSGLPVTYASSDPAVATVTGNVVTVVGTGTTVITASQAGDANHLAATPVAQSLVATADPLELFTESFASITSGSSTSTSGSSSTWSGSANWNSVSSAWQAGGAVRLGTSGSAGSITTRPIDLSGNGGAFTLSFDVQGWSTVEGDIVVTLSGQAPRTVSYTNRMADGFATKTLSFTGGQANSTLTFATSAKRAFLDNILITVPNAHEIAGGFWNDVDGDGVQDPGETALAGWTVYLDADADGALDAGERTTVTASDGGYAFTGLVAGTYVVATVVPEGWALTLPAVARVASTPEPRHHQSRAVPNDPLFAQQWHLQNTGQQGGLAGEDANVVSTWGTFGGTGVRGSGVVIGIVDDGLQHTHPDLAANYRSALSWDFNGNDANPAPSTDPMNSDDHGTAVAGVAAAVGNNSLGVTGVAPAAGLAGLRLTAGAVTDQVEANAFTWKLQDIDIYNNSWGPTDDARRLEGPGPLALAALETGVTTGRDGKGVIYVWAAGNGLEAGDNVNYDGYANSRYTIAVTAIDNRGEQAWYAEPGAAILVAAHSNGNSSGAEVGITTTDLVGTVGYSSNDYAADFGGTSSATPLVSGTVALMLEANPNLGWRDVQHVLVNSARRNDPTDAGWTPNGAGKWVNHKYGFGAVDAGAAVSLAQTWTNVGPEARAATGTITVGQTIPDNNAAGITSSFTLSSDITVEWVEVVFNATHTNRGDLEVILTSPSGTQSVLAERHADIGDHYSNWTFTTARNWGEDAAGTWTIRVADRRSGTVGTFGSWSMNVFGTGTDGGGGGGGGGGGTVPGTHSVVAAGGRSVSGVNFGARSTTPTILASGTLAAVDTVYGSASATPTCFAVSGTALTGGLTVTAPAGFELSTSPGSGYTAAGLVLAPTDGVVAATTVYLRLAASTAVGTYDGVVTVSGGGATAQTISMPASTVAKKQLAVTAVDASRDEGQPNPTFTATITGFVNGETAAVLSGTPSLGTTATAASLPGTYTITVDVGSLVAANYSFTFVSGTLTVVDVPDPVRVKGVFVRGTAWDAGYLGLAPFTTQAGAALGWQLRDGAAQTLAAAGVTWNNVNVVSVLFDQPIATPAVTALALVRGDAGGASTVLRPAAVELLAGGTVARWIFAGSLVNGRYVVSLASAGIENAARTTTLDGEWNTGTSTFAAGSGDGTAGGIFNFRFHVLVGDVNLDGTVNNTDTTTIRNRLFRTVDTKWFRTDLNGSNSVTAADSTTVRQGLFKTHAGLPAVAAPAEPGLRQAQSRSTLLRLPPARPQPTPSRATLLAWALYGDATGSATKKPR